MRRLHSIYWTVNTLMIFGLQKPKRYRWFKRYRITIVKWIYISIASTRQTSKIRSPASVIVKTSPCLSLSQAKIDVRNSNCVHLTVHGLSNYFNTKLTLLYFHCPNQWAIAWQCRAPMSHPPVQAPVDKALFQSQQEFRTVWGRKESYWVNI